MIRLNTNLSDSLCIKVLQMKIYSLTENSIINALKTRFMFDFINQI